MITIRGEHCWAVRDGLTLPKIAIDYAAVEATARRTSEALSRS
jgi:hypothetical protein